ncbi:MAG TPA: hypothetical protein VH143_32785 [Kofleriaceae bacterium]|jgi:hypothetical protein|nr:hypothetical protein [Kofleriaceae bacterium]
MNMVERAEGLGMSPVESIRFLKRHRELFAHPVASTLGALARIGRHARAGEPMPDISRLVYRGDSTVRAILLDTLSKLPPAIAWHLVEFVAWYEVGRGNTGWMAPTLTQRAPGGDTAHTILINGGTSDEWLPHLFVHEGMHSWHRAIVDNANESSAALEPRQDFYARVLLVYNYDADACARHMLAGERLADESARALGFLAPQGSSDHNRLRSFRDGFAALRTRADEIAVELGLDKKAG